MDIGINMNSYELTIVLPGKVTAAKKKSVAEKVKKLVSTLKGKVKDEKNWGEKELAYKIGKNDTGNFVHFTLELEPKSVKDLSDKLKLEDRVIRYLLVKGK